jgi:L-asparagine transporter-like permease
MSVRDYEAVEAWATRSKLRALLFLLALGVFISAGLFAGASLLAKMAEPAFLPALAAHSR